jgi:ubiquinone/menaquinone biosynthesis C-methylase UbiE
MTQTKDAAFWTRHAARYARAKIGDEAGYDRSLMQTRKRIEGAAQVLELGCGTGMTAIRLAPGVGEYLATDIADGMIGQAQTRLQSNPRPNLRFELATAEELAARGARFDAILGFNYLHLVRDLPRTLRAIYAMLPAGGVLVSKTPCVGEMSPLIRMIVPPLQWLGKAPFLYMLREADLRAALLDAGFTLDDVARHGTKRNDPRVFIVARKP